MLRLLKSKKAQNTMEYAILIAVVIGVVTAMQLYFKRGMQAHMKEGTDNIPEMVLNQAADGGAEVRDLFSGGTQYEPYYYEKGEYNRASTGNQGTEKGATSESGGYREVTGASSQSTGTQQVAAPNEEDLPD